MTRPVCCCAQSGSVESTGDDLKRILSALFIAGLQQALPVGAQRPDSVASVCTGQLGLTHPGWSSVWTDYERAAQLAGAAEPGSLNVRRTASRAVFCPTVPQPWLDLVQVEPRNARLELLPVHTRGEYNSTYPYDRNNSALWGGRGGSAIVELGVAFRSKYLDIELRPAFAYQQNRTFELPAVERAGRSEYGYPWHHIDLPIRFGPDAYTTVDAGQSNIRLHAFGAAAGISNQNLWWGPAIRNPILMSNSAPGFLHGYVGTDGPLDVRIGKLEMELVWGALEESKYFDDVTSNNDRWLTGIVASFEPRWTPGLHIGFARSHIIQTSEVGGLANRLLSGYRGVRDNARENQLATAFGRWVFPESGFEAYVEWGREDHWGKLPDLLKEPDHSQGYTLGIEKLFRRADGNWVTAFAEVTKLQGGLNVRGGRGSIPFYTHSRMIQGYTQRGQMLGAGIGPGADAQSLGVDFYGRTHRTGFLLERTRYNDNAYYDNWAALYEYHGHDVEVTAELHHAHRFGPVLFDAGLSYSGRYNRHFVGFETRDYIFRYDRNWRALLQMSWTPSLRLNLGGIETL